MDLVPLTGATHAFFVQTRNQYRFNHMRFWNSFGIETEIRKSRSDTLVTPDRPICKLITSCEVVRMAHMNHDETILQFTGTLVPIERLDFLSSRQYFNSNNEI